MFHRNHSCSVKCSLRGNFFLKCDFFFYLKTAFFRQHGCSTNDTNAKYNSRAAQMYREKIRQLANAALSKYGTDVSVNQVIIDKLLLHCRYYFWINA